jgi:hypothetical protein
MIPQILKGLEFLGFMFLAVIVLEFLISFTEYKFTSYLSKPPEEKSKESDNVK